MAGNLKNLIIMILNERCFTKATIVDLPTNNEMFRAITGKKYELARNENIWNNVSELCIVKWLVNAYDYQ